MKFDELLTEIGEFGRYQKFVFLLTWPPNIMAGFLLLNPVILLATPLHRCAIPGHDNDTYAVQDGNHASLINLTIPPSDKDGEVYARCDMYAPRYKPTGYGADYNIIGHSNVSMVTCDRWVYDTSVFKDTYVSKLDLVCDRKIWAANAAMLLFGGMLFGSIVCGTLADRFGRKIVMVVSTILMTSSGLGMAWANSYALLLFLEFCVGASTVGSFLTAYIVCMAWANSYALLLFLEFCVGASTVGSFLTAYIVSLEITGTKKRLWPGICVNFPYCIGLLLYCAITNGFRSVTHIQMTTAIPGVIFVAYWWIMPESPRWLLSRGHVREAELILQRAARWNGTALPENFFDDKLIDEIREEDKGANITGLFTNQTMLRRLLLICFNWAACAFCYYGLALNTEHLTGNFYLNFFLSSIVEIPAYFIIIGSVERIGRRLIYIIVMAVGGVSCVSTLLAIQYAKDMEVLVVCLAMIGRLGVTAGFCVQYIHSAEIFPTVLRNAGMGVASVFARVGSMVAPYIVSLGGMVGGSFGRALPLIIVGVFALLTAIATGFLPETLNKDLPDTVTDGENLGRSAEKDREMAKL